MTDAENLRCAYEDCGLTRKADSEFCTGCSFRVARDSDQLVRETANYLVLEAAFVQWCVDNGHPNPHE